MMNNRMQVLWKKYQNWILGVMLVVGMGILYLPTLTSYFISDDFTYLAIMYFNFPSLLAGQKWYDLLILGHDPRNLRPAGMFFVFLNYVMWGTDASGYHLTDIILAIFCVILVYAIARQLVHNRRNAIITALLFAVQPMHPGAVSWMAAACYDVLVAFFCLTSFLFFLRYNRANRTWYYIMALGAFILALLTKETAMTWPAVLLVYDLLFNLKTPIQWFKWIKRHAPFWIGLGAYVAVRIFGTGTFGYKTFGITMQDLLGWTIGMLNNMGDPFLENQSIEIHWLVLGLIPVLALLYRTRREIVFGLAWIPILFFPVIASASGPSGRSFYLPSFGVALALSSILLRPTDRPRLLLQWLGILVLILMVAVDSTTLYSRNQILQRASQVAEAIPAQIKQIHPTLEPQDRLIFVGVPDRTPEGTLIYVTGFGDAMAVAYGTRQLTLFRFSKFPIWLDDLSRTYLLQVDHRRVIERTDLLDALKARQACSSFSQSTIDWNFAHGLQSWEAWNDIADFAVRDGMLVARIQGNGPILGSPTFDIPAMAIGEVRITMRVRSTASNLQGNVYWLATDQSDFFPGLNKSFVIQADGEWHTYSVDLAQTGALLIGDHITQLRIDPANAPAEIEIQKIEITTHCSKMSGQVCNCDP